ncbi:L-allo-threonine dehydrogenase [Acinetobacter baumannii]|nr:L-allo-threonine dehydrogenase [Acinetobacter baumannii]
MLALVTGASAGFGYSISKKLIESGYKVIGCGRRAEKLEELQKQLGENFYPLVFDMTDTAENINKLFLCTRQISQNPYPIRVLPS